MAEEGVPVQFSGGWSWALYRPLYTKLETSMTYIEHLEFCQKSVERYRAIVSDDPVDTEAKTLLEQAIETRNLWQSMRERGLA